MGVGGDESLVRKLRSMVEKSESCPECVDEELEEDDVSETLRMSGAVKACTFVVDINSVGREMLLRSIVPGVYRTVLPLTGVDGVPSSLCRFKRLVKALARDMLSIVVF